MAMQEISSNRNYFRRHRILEARQERLHSLRSVDGTSSPTPNAIRIERPEEQAVTTFEKTTQ